MSLATRYIRYNPARRLNPQNSILARSQYCSQLTMYYLEGNLGSRIILLNMFAIPFPSWRRNSKNWKYAEHSRTRQPRRQQDDNTRRSNYRKSCDYN